MLAACSGASADVDPAQRYVCAGGRGFDVIRSAQGAIVSLNGRTYNLEAKPSSLGQRYASAEATLIVDAEFAAFVTNKDMSLTKCQLSS